MGVQGSFFINETSKIWIVCWRGVTLFQQVFSSAIPCWQKYICSILINYDHADKFRFETKWNSLCVQNEKLSTWSYSLTVTSEWKYIWVSADLGHCFYVSVNLRNKASYQLSVDEKKNINFHCKFNTLCFDDRLINATSTSLYSN